MAGSAILAPSPEAATHGWRSERRAWITVAILAFAYTLSQIDRTILVLFVEPLKRDMQLDDIQIGLLMGTAFALFYVVCGLPFGWLADRLNRSRIIGLSIFGWSLATLACGFSGTFWQLFAGRLAVGVGEAGLGPSAISLLSDYFPRDRLARPIALMSLGATAGVGLTMIFGGALIAAVDVLENSGSPLTFGLSDWQLALMILGLFGCAYSLLFLWTKEAPRTNRISPTGASLGAVLAFSRRRFDVIGAVVLGQGLTQVAFLSFIAWTPSFLIRTAGWTPTRTGYVLGAVILAGSTCAVLSVGIWQKMLRSRGELSDVIRISMLATVLAIAPAIAVTLAPSPLISMLLLLVSIYLCILAISLGPVPIQMITPNEMRGQMVALLALVNAILGTMLGPFLVGLLTEKLFRDPLKVGWSIAVIMVVCLPLSALAWRWAFRSARTIERSRSAVGAAAIHSRSTR